MTWVYRRDKLWHEARPTGFVLRVANSKHAGPSWIVYRLGRHGRMTDIASGAAGTVKRSKRCAEAVARLMGR